MKKSCACYAIWNEKIGLWEFLQKSKPNQQEAHLYEEVVILPLANRAELVARARVAAEDAEKMRALEQHVIELKGHAHKCDCERWLAGEEIDEDGDHSYQYTEGVACTCGLDKLLPPAAAQEGGGA